MQLETGGFQRWTTIIGQCAAHRQSIVPNGCCLGIRARFQGPFDGTNPAHVLFQLRLRMAIRLENGQRSIAQVVILTQLMRNLRKDEGNGIP